MSARAIWKGVITFGEVRVPVKLYTALEDRELHFRMLHAEDQAPVRQELVNPETGAVVSHADANRAFMSRQGDLVLLHEDELAALEPEASRDIQILQFLPLGAIDHRWHVRPYYLGPDEGGLDAYPALTAALARRYEIEEGRFVIKQCLRAPQARLR